MTTCIFSLTDNKLTTVSGADAGTYEVINNSADIVIGGVTSAVNPLKPPTYQGSTNNNQITAEI